MNKLKRYAELKQTIYESEREITGLKREIFDLVAEEADDTLNTKWGKFEIRNGRSKWEYSAELNTKEEQVKEKIKYMKKAEEISGVAKQMSAPTNLVFASRKA